MTKRRNVYGMDFTMERDTEGSRVFGTLAEVLGYGCYDEFENDTFKYIPFDYDIDGGDDETCRPLFIHKRTGFKMYWYKYPLRYAYCNIENMTSDFLKDIVEDCVKSLSIEQQTEYYNMIIFGKFKEYLGIPKYKVCDEPYRIEEFIRDREGKILEIVERNDNGIVLKRTTYKENGDEDIVIDYRESTYSYNEYEITKIGKIRKRYITSYNANGDYSNSEFVLDKRVILENKDGMEVSVETNYYGDGHERTSVMIDYNGSHDYTSIIDGVRETYIHDKDGILRQLIVTDTLGHKTVYNMDTVNHVDGTIYHFQNGNFIAKQKDVLGRIILNVNAEDTIKTIFDGVTNKVKTREYYTTLLDDNSEKELENITQTMQKLTKNSYYGQMSDK